MGKALVHGPLHHVRGERGCLKHDDRLDALSMAIAYWVDQMAQNAEDSFEKHQERLRDEEFKKFIREVKGRGRPKRSTAPRQKRFAHTR